MDDRRIVQAHREAYSLALSELEQFAATRIRKGGIEEGDRTTGNLIGAAFLHTTSRALDPQLHTHFVLFNATFDPKEQRWKALQTSALFDAIHYGTEVYRNELVKRLHRLGYQTRSTSEAFEIEGVSPKVIEQFSKRSQERDRAVKAQEQKLGSKCQMVTCDCWPPLKRYTRTVHSIGGMPFQIDRLKIQSSNQPTVRPIIKTMIMHKATTTNPLPKSELLAAPWLANQKDCKQRMVNVPTVYTPIKA